MAKRQKLDYNNQELAQNLKESTGQGVNALFSPPSPPAASARMETPLDKPEVAERNRLESDHQAAEGSQKAKTAIKQANNIAINIDCNIAISQQELDQLRLTGFKAQTFRFTEEELERLKEQSYSLSRLLKKKIGQGDLLRVSLLLFDKAFASQQESLLAILKEI